MGKFKAKKETAHNRLSKNCVFGRIYSNNPSMYRHRSKLGIPDGKEYAEEIKSATSQNQIIEAIATMPRTRAELKEITGLSPLCIYRNTKLLVEAGVLVEDEWILTINHWGENATSNG